MHSVPRLGVPTERWIYTQLEAARDFDGKIFGLQLDEFSKPGPGWVLPRRWGPSWFAWRNVFRSRDLGSWWLSKSVGREPPAAVHAHYGMTGTQLLRLAHLLHRPLLCSFYGFDASRKEIVEDRLWKRRYAEMFDRAQAFVAEGPAMAERIRGLGSPSEKVHVIRLPADAPALARVKRREASTFTVVAAGRFTEKKGFDTAIKAFALAFEDRSDARLLLVGSGELDKDYRELVHRLRIESKVTFTGSLHFVEFMETIGTAHIAVYPSRVALDGDSEGGAPVTLVESQWLGVPSIVSTHDDLPFVAAPDGSIVLEEQAPSVWAEALEAVYADPTRRASMATHARRFAHDYHSPEANARERESLYAKVIGQCAYP